MGDGPVCSTCMLQNDGCARDDCPNPVPWDDEDRALADWHWVPSDSGSKLRRQVTAFHQAFGVPVLDRPQVPSEERVRLRLRLVAEEFCELLSAAGCPVASLRIDNLLRESIDQLEGAGDFNLVEFADALGDLDYVIEGTRAEMGIDGGPIADAIHASNMAKVGGPVVNGKITKPQGWTPPDIAGLLKKQGWEG